jgi:hypothetical protein
MNVSVIIPTFQRREQVVRAVESVLAQTYPATEVIVVDDGSTDATVHAMAGFGGRVLYLQQANAGPAAARNLGLRHASGEIVAFLDSDDRWLPRHLATIVASLANHPRTVVASTCPGFGFGARLFGQPTGLVAPLPRLLIGNFIGYPSCTAARREALLAVGGFDEELAASEPYDLWLRLAHRGPFVLVRRRSVVRTVLGDSRHATSVRSGVYLDGREQIGLKLARELGTTSRSFSTAIQSYRSFVAALRAFEEGDRAGAAAALADSCRLMPARSSEPWLIGGWLGGLPSSQTPEGRLDAFLWAAGTWPAPESKTARGLRLHASVQAVRLGRLGLAAKLIG